MALNFPDSPTLNQVYTDATSGFSYQWDGYVWQSYTPSGTKNILIIDDISASFNGSTQTFALASSGTALTPANAQQLRVVLGGIVQEPVTDYTVSGSNITFTTAPGSGLDCSIVSLGPAIPLSSIIDGSVTPAKLSTGGPSWNTSGDVYIAGITTIVNASGKVIAGIGTTALIVEGNARVTGILTVGTSSITLNGTTDSITVGTGLTLTSSGIQAGVITATSLVVGSGVTINSSGVNVSGVITATSFVGNGSGLTGAGSTVADDTTTNGTFYPVFTQTTSGTITASKVSTTKLSYNPSTGTLNATAFVGNGSGLTGAGSTVADDTTTNATFYPLLTQTTSGTVTASKVSTTKLSFNPSTGGLSVTSLSGSLANTLTLNTSGTGLSGSTTYNNSGAATFTVTSNATSANTVSTIVARDASGNFSAGTITAALSGNSSTASTLQTARTINGISFNGSADIVVNPSSGAYSNGYGTRTVSTSAATGGSDGDIWYQY